MRGKGFGFTHFQWKRCCRAATLDLQWGLCQANHSCTASSSAESLLVLRFPSDEAKDTASVQAAPPVFSLRECLKRGVRGAVVSLVPQWLEQISTTFLQLQGGQVPLHVGIAGLYKALQQSNTSYCFPKELLQGHSHRAHEDRSAPCTYRWRLWELKGVRSSNLRKSLRTGPPRRKSEWQGEPQACFLLPFFHWYHGGD